MIMSLESLTLNNLKTKTPFICDFLFKILALHHCLLFNNCELLLHYCVKWLFQFNVPCMLSACFYQKLHIYVSFQLIEVRKKIECGIGMLK